MIILLVLFILAYGSWVYIDYRRSKDNPNRSENDIMFLCQVDIINNRPTHETDILYFMTDYKVNKGVEKNNNFSFDNLLLVACWCKKFMPEGLSDIKLFGRHTWRLDNFAFLMWAKYPLIGWPFLIIISPLMIISMMRVWHTDKYGNKYIDTDGKIISYFKTECFNLKLTRKILDYIIQSKDNLKSWQNIFWIYFNSEENIFVYDAFILKKVKELS